ncbi:MAG TPA: MarR family transcriptional regulator [Sphingobium sp.]|nr:MarR family transcriptional regulator [Sphingobium sp.]
MTGKSHDRADEGDTTTGARLASPLDRLLGYRLRRASMMLMSDIVSVLRPFNLSVGEASLLIVVGANPGCRQSDVGRALEIKRANLTPLVGRMKARDLITDAPIDGRSLSLTLTCEGLALQSEILARIEASDSKARDQLNIDQQSLLAALREIAP